MKCAIKNCPGEYEEKFIVHTVKKNNNVMVFENVPAEVCNICGDTLLTPETICHLEELIKENREPERMIPLYEYA